MKKYSARKLALSLSPGGAREFYFFAKKQKKTNKLLELCKLVRKPKRLDDAAIAKELKIRESHLPAYLNQLSDLLIEFLAIKELKESPSLNQYLKYSALKKYGFDEKAERELKKAIEGNPMGIALEEVLPALFNSGPAHQKVLQGSGIYQDLIQLIQLKELSSKLDIGIKEIYSSKPHISAMDSIAADYPIINQPESISNPRVKAEYHFVKRRISIFQMDIENAEIHIRAFLETVNQYDYLKRELAQEAVGMLERLILIEISKGRYSSARSHIPQFSKYGKGERGLDLVKQFIKDRLILTIAIDTGETYGEEINPNSFFRKLIKLKGKLSEQKYMVSCYSAGLFACMKGEWSIAQRIVDWNLKESKVIKTTNERRYAILLKCMILLEKKELIHLEDYLPEARAALEPELEQFRFFQWFFQMIHDHIKSDPVNWPGLARKWKVQLAPLTSDEVEMIHFSPLNLIDWLESRLKHQSWIKIVKARLRKEDNNSKWQKAGS